jgi:perosamine synthetase
VIPYGKQNISQDDIDAVVKCLKSDFITTGPKIPEFENALCEFSNTDYAVAVSSGTAALHCAMVALGITKGDEVIVSTLTFAASANCIVYQNATPIFADSIENSLLIDPVDVERKITSKTKAIIAVDYAGQPCDYDALRTICDKYNLFLVSDACHSIGGSYNNKKTGSLADITCFSFHPVKHITTGEGGAALTNNEDLASKMRIFRNHGITTDYRQRELNGAHYYEMTQLGFNYRITDFQCALGISQLKKLNLWIEKRNQIAEIYDSAFLELKKITPLYNNENVLNAYHLYVVKLDESLNRDAIFLKMRNAGIGVNVHYIPVHLHPYYKNTFATTEGQCPVAEEAYQHIISLPMFPSLSYDEILYVIDSLSKFSNI